MYGLSNGRNISTSDDFLKVYGQGQTIKVKYF